MEKLNRQLAEAEAALEARRKPPVVLGPCVVGEGLVIDEWVNFSSSPINLESVYIIFIFGFFFLIYKVEVHFRLFREHFKFCSNKKKLKINQLIFQKLLS